MLCEEKWSVPRERAAAKALEVEDGGAAPLICVGETSPALCEAFDPCLRSCKAFASAFSCVRTK